MVSRIKVLIVLLFLSFDVSAQFGFTPTVKSTWILTSDIDLACEGQAYLVTLSGTKTDPPMPIFGMPGRNFFIYQVSPDGINNWTDAVSTMTEDTVFANDMAPIGTSKSVFVRALDAYRMNASNTIEIKLDETNSCAATCHTSSTGDFIMGTDFNPVDPSNTNPRLPDGVESYFGEHSITFDKNSEENYTIQIGLNENFAGHRPNKDGDTVANYYYNYNTTIPGGNSYPFKLGFPKGVFHGQHYTYTMRMYLLAKPGCDQWGSATIKARTSHGTVSTDSMEVYVYDDETDQLLDYQLNGMEGGAAIYYFDKARLTGQEWDTGWKDYPHLIRMELTFYGKLPDNQQEDIQFTPMIEQLQCAYVAIDYISAQIASICMTKGTSCVGSTTTVNAAGFPRSAVYHWEELDPVTNTWNPIIIDGVPMTGSQYKQLELPVSKVGVTYYRLWSPSVKTDDEVDYFNFKVVGKACDPTSPNLIVGTEYVCAPNDTAIVYEAFPATNDPDYAYRWSLFGPGDLEITDKSVIDYNIAGETKSVAVHIPANYPDGDYRMHLQMVKVVGGVDNAIGDPVDTILKVYQRPDAEINVIKGAGKQAICPYADSVMFGSKFTSEKYTYIWENAVATDTNTAIAKVNVPANYCNVDSFNATLIVAIDKFKACADTAFTKFGIDKTQPVIDCEGLGGDRDLYLSSTAADTLYLLPKPVITETCDGNPTVEIEGKGLTAGGQTVNIKVSAKYDMIDDVLKVTIPVTTGKVGGVNDKNGIRFTYVAKDGCGLPSDTCAFVIYVRDTFPPKVVCEDMPNYVINDSLSKYPFEDCEATPGKGGHLPVLTEPYLEDKLHPGVMIKGEFEGRIHNGVEEEGVDLNDPYKIGTTLIRWKFYDDARNNDSCFQTVNVVDDKKPDVYCPALNNFRVHPDKNECTLSADSLVEQIKQQLGVDLPYATDRCEDSVLLSPTYFYREVGTSEWFAFDSDTKFQLNTNYELEWRFYKNTGVGVDNTVYAACSQTFRVIDDKEPDFDCGSIPDHKLIKAPSGQCEAPKSAFFDAFLPWPFATVLCTGDTINGQVTLADGSPLPETFPVGEDIFVKWTFYNPEKSTGIKICEGKAIRFVSDIEPKFDCSTLDDLKIVVAPSGACEATKQWVIDSFDPWPTAEDACTGKKIPGVVTLRDGSPLPDVFPVGDTIEVLWTFSDTMYTTAVKTCEKAIKVISDKEIDGDCNNKEKYPDINLSVKDNKCAVVAADVLALLTDHFADHPCIEGYKIKAIGSRLDGAAMNDEFGVGTHYIVWTFTDSTESLVNNTSTCEQKVLITDNNLPSVKCDSVFPKNTIYLDSANCAADFSMIETHLVPPVNPCNGDVAVVTTKRSSGKDLNDPYEVGTDVITWTLTYESTGMTSFCDQIIEVIDTIAPDFDCSTLAETIELEQRDSSKNSVSFQAVKDAGFYIPVVTDKCCDVRTEVTRSDNRAIEDDYPMGHTIVTFRFYDDHGNFTECKQDIFVRDMIPPVINCPKVDDGNLACISSVPDAITTYEEFKAAGGSVVPEERAVLGSIRHEDVVTGDSCSSLTVRDYFFTLVNGETASCQNPQEFRANDTIAPVISGVGPLVEYNTTCSVLDTVPPVVSVSDNCDPNPVLTLTRVSTQGDDPSKCDYYQFDVTYTWTAVDRCGNQATAAVYKVHVLNQDKPEVVKPKNWDLPIYPDYLKNCNFGVPNIINDLPLENISLNCGSTEYINIYQVPAAGTLIDSAITIYLYVEDPCGNATILERKLNFQDADERLQVVVNPVANVCGIETDEPRAASNSLSHSSIRNSIGTIYKKDFIGIYRPTSATVVWDCYLESIDAEHILYSNNANTYAWMFADANENTPEGNAAYARYNLLTRRSQSGNYIYVATDTLTGCKDTGYTYIDVREVPRLALNTNAANVCEGDSIPLHGQFGVDNPVCIEPYGAPVTAYGWMLNGQPYVPQTPVLSENGEVQTMYFYATNECGTTTTLNSLHVSCSGDPVTQVDSISEAGSYENYLLWKEDKLYTHDSVLVYVFHHSNPSEVLLTAKQNNPSKIFDFDQAELILSTPNQPSYTVWMKVVGEFDGRSNALYSPFGQVVNGGSGEGDDIVLGVDYGDSLMKVDYNANDRVKNTFVVPATTDTSYYYALVGNGVCPTVASNLVKMDIVQIPTAITPYNLDGFNDVFMKGRKVVIFNRYGGRVYEGNDGWNGTSHGLLVDPGVYFYEVFVGDHTYKGSIEVVKVD